MKKRATYHELCKLLYQACKEGRSGTLFVTSDENRAAHFTLMKGEIVFCSFGSKRGLQCLELFRQIGGGNYSFSSQIFAVHDPHPIGSQDMIFHELGFANGNPESDEPLGYAARPSPAAAAAAVAAAGPAAAPAPAARAKPAPTPAEDLEATVVLPPMTNSKIGPIICEELAYYMGPAAPLVCESYQLQIDYARGAEALSLLILNIARELPDMDQQQEFVEQVQMRLRDAKLI